MIVAAIILTGIFMLLCLWVIGNDGGKEFDETDIY